MRKVEDHYAFYVLYSLCVPMLCLCWRTCLWHYRKKFGSALLSGNLYITIILQIYAGSFFAIPLFRWFIIRKRNADIEQKNQVRERFARALELPDLSLRRKVAILAPAFLFFCIKFLIILLGIHNFPFE